MTPPVFATQIQCPKCGLQLDRTYWNQSQLQPCQHCQTNLRLLVFPAAMEPPPLAPANPNAMPGEATCFNHANRQAHVPCAACGRFLCAVCDLEFRGEHWCPSCLKQQSDAQTSPLFQRSRMRWDSLALLLATLPAFLVYPTVLTAPVALFLSIRHWKEDPGFLPRTRIRRYLALIFSATQILCWIALFGFLIFSFSKIFPRRLR